MVDTAIYGRHDEIERLEVFIGDISSGGSRTIVIDGPVGIGKTRLLQTAIERATRAGVHTGRAAARVGSGALSPLLGAVSGGEPALLSVPKRFDSMDSTEGVFGALEWVADALLQRARRGPILVAVDDLQWADPLTLFALPALISHLAAAPVGWLLARRPLPSCPSGEQSVVALANAGAEFMSLPPLLPGDIARLAADALHADPGRALQEALAGAGGNPLLTVEFVREAWSSTGVTSADRYTLPDGLFERLLNPLSELSRRTAELASGLGKSFAASDLAELSEYGPSDLDAAIEELSKAGLILEDPPRLRFRHDLLRQALATRLAPEVSTAAEAIVSRRATDSHVSFQQSGADRLGWASLTAAELRIARLVVEGLTNREIAALLTVSPHTIDHHMKNAFSKLRVRSRVRLAGIVLAHERTPDQVGASQGSAQ